MVCVIMMTQALTSCIRDDGKNCVQYVVAAQLVNRDGVAFPDSIANLSSAYLFINGNFSREVEYAEDHCYHIRFNGCDNLQLAVFGDKDINDFGIISIGNGSALDKRAVRLDSLIQPDDTLKQSKMFYGLLDFSTIIPEETDTAKIIMYDRLARIRFLFTKRCIEKYDGQIDAITVQGVRTGFSYDGNVHSETVTLTPKLGNVADSTKVSQTFSTFALPTPLVVTLWCNATRSETKDSAVLFATTTDYQGNPLKAEEGEDKVFIVDLFGEGNTVGIMIKDWDYHIDQVVDF